MPEFTKEKDDLVSAFGTLDPMAVEQFKARQGFFEHLMLLNGATLSLIITATGVLAYQHPATIRPEVAHHVVVGCWWLITAVVLSLVHNHLNIVVLVNLLGGRYSWTLRFKFHAFYNAIPAGTTTEEWAEIDKRFSTAGKMRVKIASVMDYSCAAAGYVAEAATVVGYIQFLLVLSSMIRG